MLLRFVINDKGDLSQIEIVEGATNRYNAEAVRVLIHMPHWEQARQFGNQYL